MSTWENIAFIINHECVWEKYKPNNAYMLGIRLKDINLKKYNHNTVK